MRRRTFLKAGALAAGPSAAIPANSETVIDFRYAPLAWQTAICLPDDPHKSLVGERGQLLYGHPGRGRPIDYFPVIVEFSVAGMEADRVVRQRLEDPAVPIVHTRLERPELFVDVIAFATSTQAEGRVDNVIFELRPKRGRQVWARPVVTIRTRESVLAAREADATVVRLGGPERPPLLVADAPLRLRDTGTAGVLTAEEAEARPERPLRLFFRFPQQQQEAARLLAGLRAPEAILEEARNFWRTWSPCHGGVAFSLPGRYGEFFTASARNILQARERRDGRLTFQVGPTVYRGLWVVDGHFLLEAARYLGYTREVWQGLETTWSYQDASGGIFAGAGKEHFKDTAIAMFTLVRLAELDQDWSYFQRMQPEILRGVRFLEQLRERARREGSANGRYGLLCRGMGDGGLGGIRSEFTNTLWTLAGLRAVAEAGERLGWSEAAGVRRFYEELRDAFFAAARQEMRRHPAGFDYLPMLMREDPQWEEPDERRRPRPQVAQWALSQAIYPGLVFAPDDPVVAGHIALMQASTAEDVPIETGWIPHEGLWVYNAAFVAHVYLWAGLSDWARLTFHGFLNHASPLYCWREEQPLRGSAVAGYVGDMPHNWASAECILFLRHMLALEDGSALRLLAGVGDFELASGQPYTLLGSPTRFGALDLRLADEGGAWRLEFKRGGGPAPAHLSVPARLGSRHALASVQGASFTRDRDVVRIDPAARAFSVVWRRVSGQAGS